MFLCLCIIFFLYCLYVFFFKQKTAYEMRISDWSSDVCSSDLVDLLDIQCVEVGFGDAAQVHRRHLRAVGTGADRKALAAAVGAELMVDIMLVELIGFELVGAALQPEPVDGNDGQEKALAEAVRAVAAHRRFGNVAPDRTEA